MQEKADRSEDKTVCAPHESDSDKSDTSVSESSCDGTPGAKEINTEEAEICDQVSTTNVDNITKNNGTEEEQCESEACQPKDKSVCNPSECSEVEQSRKLDNTETDAVNNTVVSVAHEKQKLLTKENESKSSCSDESDTACNNEEGDDSKCDSNSRSLTKSDIEADILEGKRKVLRKIKIKEEPMDSSSYSVDEVVVKQEPKEENSMSTSYEEYDPTFVVKTDWHTICTQSQAGEDKGKPL